MTVIPLKSFSQMEYFSKYLVCGLNKNHNNVHRTQLQLPVTQLYHIKESERHYYWGTLLSPTPAVRLEMMPTCFVSKLLYYTIQCHAQGVGSSFECWPFNDTFDDIFLYINTEFRYNLSPLESDQPSKVV